jgi:hypothetical protein
MSKENSSSSGTLFARPTKEWVVPQRAKPGRKSTKQNVKTDAIVGNAAMVVKGGDGDSVSGIQCLIVDVSESLPCHAENDSWKS